MEFDPLFLSRLQVAFVVAFHFLLPAFTIGLLSTSQKAWLAREVPAFGVGYMKQAVCRAKGSRSGGNRAAATAAGGKAAALCGCAGSSPPSPRPPRARLAATSTEQT
jgi:hypothetical protein